MGDSGENATTSSIAATKNKVAKKTEMGWRGQPGILHLNFSRETRHWAIKQMSYCTGHAEEKVEREVGHNIHP